MYNHSMHSDEVTMISITYLEGPMFVLFGSCPFHFGARKYSVLASTCMF